MTHAGDQTVHRRFRVVLCGLLASVVLSPSALWSTQRGETTVTGLAIAGTALFIGSAALAGWWFVRAGGLSSRRERRQLVPAIGVFAFLAGPPLGAWGVAAAPAVSYGGLFVLLASVARDTEPFVPEVAGDGTPRAFRLREMRIAATFGACAAAAFTAMEMIR